MDHLPQLISNICADSKIAAAIASGRTKTSAIVKNVVGNEHFTIICENLRRKKFSLIVDESTDLTTEKHLCLVVRYLNNKNVIEDHFFYLIKLSKADANTLYSEIIHIFNRYDIPYKQNLIGFASDGANVMMGTHHSLMTLLKNDIPSLYIIKCICHSYHLCASYACQKLPRFVEDLTRDVYNYFSSSPKRISDFVEFQNYANVSIHKILHPAQTRWLSVHMVVTRILEQYNALKLYFTDAVSQKDVLSTENILIKLNDPVTRLFLQFLDFALPIFNNLNRDMQAESPKLHIIYKNVCNSLKLFFDCYLKRTYIITTPIENIDFKNPTFFLSLEDMYFGANVQKFIIESTFTDKQLHFFRTRCLEFYLEACAQIVQRFPLKNNVLKLFSFLDPSTVKSGNVSSIIDIARIFPNIIAEKELQTLDTEWRQLRYVEEIKSFSNNIEIFWSEIRNLQSGDGANFNMLTRFVSDIMCLPHSSANVERIFSTINMMKTKRRNALNAESICGLLHTKSYIKNNNCYDFTVDDKLVSRMVKSSIYL